MLSWQGVLKDLKYHPILGYGITGYWFIDAQFFRTLIELGILGLCIFLYLLYQIARFLLETHRIASDNYVKGLSMGVFAGFITLYFIRLVQILLLSLELWSLSGF